jgi:hypothetical protein
VGEGVAWRERDDSGKRAASSEMERTRSVPASFYTEGSPTAVSRRAVIPPGNGQNTARAMVRPVAEWLEITAHSKRPGHAVMVPKTARESDAAESRDRKPNAAEEVHTESLCSPLWIRYDMTRDLVEEISHGEWFHLSAHCLEMGC